MKIVARLAPMIVLSLLSVSCTGLPDVAGEKKRLRSSEKAIPMAEKIPVPWASWLQPGEYAQIDIKLEAIRPNPDRYASEVESGESELEVYSVLTINPGNGQVDILGLEQFKLLSIPPPTTNQDGSGRLEKTPASLFRLGATRITEDEAWLGLKITESDRVLSNDERARLDRVLDQLTNAKSLAIEAKVLESATAVQWTNYLSLIKLIFWDLPVVIYEACDPDDTAFEVSLNLSRKRGYSPEFFQLSNDGLVLSAALATDSTDVPLVYNELDGGFYMAHDAPTEGMKAVHAVFFRLELSNARANVVVRIRVSRAGMRRDRDEDEGHE